MNKLPREILPNIFVHFSMSEKRKLMLVCRQWKEIISTRGLYHTVICKDCTEFERFIHLLVQTPSIRFQVQHFELDIGFRSNGVKSRIVNWFPNLRIVRFRDDWDGLEDFIDGAEIAVTKIPRKIELVEDFGDCGLLRSLVNAKACSNLRTLELIINGCKKDTITLLKDLPVLKSLKIKGNTVTMEDFETIHTNTPLLESLYINNLVPSALDSPQSTIKPATSITRLALHFCAGDVDHHIKWVRYIIHKYPQLREFRYAYKSIDITFTIHNADSMSTYSYISFFLTKMHSLTDSSMFLDTDALIMSNAIPIQLDDGDCKAKDLSLTLTRSQAVNNLVRSNQCEHIEQLSLNYGHPMHYKWLSSMKNLKSLSIAYTDLGFYVPGKIAEIYKTIDVVPFFESCPETIESVQLSDINLEFKTERTRQFPIRKLDIQFIRSSQVKELLGSNYFPYLNSLILRTEFDEEDFLMLERYHFSYLELYISLCCRLDRRERSGPAGQHIVEHGNKPERKYAHKFGYNIAVKTMNDDALRFYSYPGLGRNTRKITLDKIKWPIPKEQMEENRCLTIVCGSVKKLVVNSQQVGPFY